MAAGGVAATRNDHAPSAHISCRAGLLGPVTGATVAAARSPTPPHELWRNFLFRYRLQDGGSPSQQPLPNRPLRRRKSATILSPFPPPFRYLHSQSPAGRNAAFTSRLQPSPPCQASLRRRAPSQTRRRPGNLQSPSGPPCKAPPAPAR